MRTITKMTNCVDIDFIHICMTNIDSLQTYMTITNYFKINAIIYDKFRHKLSIKI